VHWALITGVFGKGDIGRIEREFLEVLDWELGVTEADVLAHHEGLVGTASGVAVSFSESWVPVVAKEKADAHVPSTPLSPSSAPMPELDPSSSPHSSAGSLSPRTPVSHAVSPLGMDLDVDGAASPTYTLVSPSHPMSMDVDVALPAPVPTQATTPPPKKHAPGHARRKLRDLLHAFQHHHHQHHHLGQHAVEVAA